jgi:8-oxo-dGTP diphosphatase
MLRVPSVRVIAAAVIVSERLLLVSKHAAPDVLYLPGGKPDPGESPLECLSREIFEELGCSVVAPTLLCEVHAPAALEDADMHMTVFAAALAGVPTPAAEIASLVWWPASEPVVIAPGVRDFVIPELSRRGLLGASGEGRFTTPNSPLLRYPLASPPE